MSTIKSSDDHLVLNAEGTAKDTKIQANGTDLVTIKSGGNIGIGTSNPTQRLHASAPSSPALLENSGGGDYQLDLKTSGATYNARIGVNTGNNFIFNCNNSEKLRIQSGGGISFNGDTAAANALDDYEEGTFTPYIRDASSGGNAQVMSGTSTYTKIGNVVNFAIYANNIITTGLTATNQAYITGLPFSMKNGTDMVANIWYQYIDHDTTTGTIVVRGISNTTYAVISELVDNNNVGPVVVNDINSGTTDIRIVGTYQTN